MVFSIEELSINTPPDETDSYGGVISQSENSRSVEGTISGRVDNLVDADQTVEVQAKTTIAFYEDEIASTFGIDFDGFNNDSLSSDSNNISYLQNKLSEIGKGRIQVIGRNAFIDNKDTTFILVTFTSLPQTIEVQDVDTPTLTLDIDSTLIGENEGSTTATVSHNIENLTEDLEITLNSSDTTEAIINPTTVTIAANDPTRTTSFTIDAVDDELFDKVQTVNLTATAPDFTSGTASLGVLSSEIEVINTNDSGFGSLREAIAQANFLPDANTITFASDLAGQTIDLNREFTISESVTIDGLASGQITIDANNNSRIFNINDGNISDRIEVTINDLNLTQASDEAIYIEGETVIEDGVVSGTGAVAITSNPSIADLDLNDSITSITVTLINPIDNAAEGLSVDGTFGSMGTVQFSNVAQINLTGLDATQSEVENLLKAITYNNSSDTPDNSDRTIQITLSDGIFSSPVAVTTVTVTPANDAPTISDRTVTLAENATVGTVVTTVSANDPDSDLTYAITSGSDRDNDGNTAFAIDSVTGEITVNDPDELDFETVSSFELNVTVTDSENLSANGSVRVNLTDVNESHTFTLDNSVTSIAENTEIATALKVADLNVTDDALGINNISLVGSDANLFEIANNQLFLKAGTILDFETQNQLQVTVVIDDETLGTTEEVARTLTIAITDIIEFPEINLKQGTTELPSGAVQNFGTIGINSGSSEYTFTLENTGNAPLNISNLTISGDRSNDFSLVDDTPTEIAPQSNTTLTIRFTPTIVGQANAVLTIVNNDSDESSYTLNLTGTTTDNTNISGTDGDNTINSQGGDNLIDAGDGDDVINGGNGGEYINGGNGNDVIDAESGSDRLFGDGGNDSLDGGVGNDFIRGGDDNDSLFGGEGNDFLIGDGGDDYLDGGFGSDRLRGGSGNNTFVLSDNEGTDIIYDFDPEVDQFELDGLNLTQLSFEDNGSNSVIKVGDRIIAQTRRVNAAQLQNYFQNRYQQ